MRERSLVIPMDITHDGSAPVSTLRAEDNPYAPPRSGLVTGASSHGKALDALLAGFLAAFAVTSIGGFVLRLAMLLDAVQTRFDHQQLAIAMRQSIQVVGVVAALAGGYLCARVARHREISLSAVQGALVLAVGYQTAAGDAGALADTRFLAIAFAASVLGGLMGRLQNGGR